MVVRLAFFLLIALVAQAVPVQAEPYLAGELGLSVPGSLSHVRFTDLPAGSNTAPLDLKTSVLFGAKAGYFFESARWLGVEFETFVTHPDIKQQRRSLNVIGQEPAGTEIPSEDFRVIVTALNMVVRAPMGRFEPYGGIGPALFVAKREFGGDSTTSKSIGLNTQLGLRVFLTEKIAVFGEWKFNLTDMSFERLSVLPAMNAVYTSNHYVIGAGYHF